MGRQPERLPLTIIRVVVIPTQDSTPFCFHESRRAVDYFGEQLRAAGYSYYGSEPLYSGVSGTLMHADIFIGVRDVEAAEEGLT